MVGFLILSGQFKIRVCLSADQFAENHLESNGVDVKRSKLEARSGILTWKWILEYPKQLWNRVEMRECRQERHRWKFLHYEHEIQVHSNSGGGDVAAKTEMVICDPSYADPAKTKAFGKVVGYTNIHEAPILELRNEDDNMIDTGQITVGQRLQVCKNDINATVVSWIQLVTSVDRYITIVGTILATDVTYLGFEYRSVHDGERRGFTVKPTAKYYDECLDIVQLQHAKAVMTPLTEPKSLNLHDETTACDQVQHSLFRAVVRKLQYITGVRPDLMFATKCLSYKLASPTLVDLTRAKKVLRYLKRNTRTESLPDDTKHITGYSDADCW